MLSCFTDLLRQNGLHSEVSSSLFLSEVRGVAPPPPSPIGESRPSSSNQEEVKPEANQRDAGDGQDMTSTFTSIPRSTFWIPADENIIETNKESSDKTNEKSSSNGTAFYIDLKNLEALASGNCSLCGKSLPEDKSIARRDSTESSPDNELCKSCQPRRRSSEDIFWIPFTDKRKASALKSLNKVENGDDCRKTNCGKKSEDKNQEQCKLQEITDTQTQSNQPNVIADAANGNKTSVFANPASKSVAPSPPQLRSFPSNLTGFDVSCVCDNVTGVCSCTILKKDLPPSSPATRESCITDTASPSNNSGVDAIRRTSDTVDVVKTVGETTSVADSTLAVRPGNNFAVLTRTDSPSVSKSRALKQSDVILKSFSETDVYDPSAQDGANVASDSPSKELRRNDHEKHNFSSEIHQGIQLPLTSEVSNDAHKEGSSAADPSPPRQAWTTPTPRSEETGASGVRIINPFPSPVPPEDKSAVHPPIGPAGDARISNKKLTTGKKGKKGGTKSSGNTKSTKPRTKTKGQEQNGKNGKKKGKGKKKEDMKMITVQQREAGEELGLRTISQGAFEMPEDVLVPPTLSMDHLSALRPFNGRMLKGKHPILSPIPESPRSMANTPRVADVPETIKDNNVEVQEGNVTENRTQEGATGEGNAENSEGVATDEEFDVVDGGIIGKLKVIGMCVPRLKFGKSNTESDSDTELNEPLVMDPEGGTVRHQAHLPVEENSVSVTEGCELQQDIQDEADDAMEEIVRRQLSVPEERESSALSGSQSRASVDDSFTNVTGYVSSSLSQTSEQSVVSYPYSRDSAPELTESDFVTTNNESEQQLFGSRTSSERSSQSEEYSDTDSSYNSCASESPRPLSPASSLNSSDTYFSSPRDSCVNTPTPDRDMCSENSVEIDYYERMAREKSGISTSSSGSSATIRTQSNVSLGSLGNISQGSIGSFAGVVSENLVRSRLSASGRSQASTSCEEEIIWKKGNVLGRGAFGTVSILMVEFKLIITHWTTGAYN